ncbi:putative lipid II flippase FtsW (plasmid) [Rhodococcus aetherivorans]|uniref:putative lipid II flippase FtsW n=1 Tax=Rhodococcus aetherivorans TaxID=191292 RepID=UPI0026EDF620|nr:putative lipid II flippase FtsW [Rhodococcus aetherivorans]WKX02114.1 putative lipid II flippase FtsW [Rhodococcus aetherivorans]
MRAGRGGSTDHHTRTRREDPASPPPAEQLAGAGPAARDRGGLRPRLDSWVARPLHDFQTLVGVTLLLVVFGLMMVLSSSSVESLLNLGSPYARFVPQLLYALVGLAIFVVVVRIPTSVLRRGAPWFLGFAFVLLILVLLPGVGSEVYGAQSWILIGSASFQPSEVAKVALVIWTAHMVATAAEHRVDVHRVLRPIAVVCCAVLAMVVLQRDLGTAVTIAIIVMAVLWFGRFRARIIAAMAAGGALGIVIFTATVGYRSDRIRAFLNPDADPQGINYQATQARYALANGGLFGQGLGQSNSKWSYLPQAYNDFIFAVIGEELGAVGALLVIGLFAAVLWIGLRVALRSTDPFLRMLSAVATMWVVLQAFINIAYVVGLLPVTGLQLPLISAGGTSMITTLLMFGLIAHAAYREPEARVSLESTTSPRLVTRLFGQPRVGDNPRPARAPQIRHSTRPDPTGRGTKGTSGPDVSGAERTTRRTRGETQSRTTDTPGRPTVRRRTPRNTSR